MGRAAAPLPAAASPGYCRPRQGQDWEQAHPAARRDPKRLSLQPAPGCEPPLATPAGAGLQSARPTPSNPAVFRSSLPPAPPLPTASPSRGSKSATGTSIQHSRSRRQLFPPTSPRKPKEQEQREKPFLWSPAGPPLSSHLSVVSTGSLALRSSLSLLSFQIGRAHV